MEGKDLMAKANPWLLGGSIFGDVLGGIAQRKLEREKYNKEMELKRRQNQQEALAGMSRVADMYTRLG